MCDGCHLGPPRSGRSGGVPPCCLLPGARVPGRRCGPRWVLGRRLLEPPLWAPGPDPRPGPSRVTCRFPVTLPLCPCPFWVWHHPSPRRSVAVYPHERMRTSVLPAKLSLRLPPVTFPERGPRAPSHRTRTGHAALPQCPRPLRAGAGLTFCVLLWCLMQSGCPGRVWGAALSPPLPSPPHT